MFNRRIWVKYLQKEIQYLHLHQKLVENIKVFSSFLFKFCLRIYYSRLCKAYTAKVFFSKIHHKLFRKLNSGRIKIHILFYHIKNHFWKELRAARRGCWWRCCCWCSKWWTPWKKGRIFCMKNLIIKRSLTYWLVPIWRLGQRLKWNINRQVWSQQWLSIYVEFCFY